MESVRWTRGIYHEDADLSVLESADGSPSDEPGEYSVKMLISLLWYSADEELPMKSRKKKRIRTLRES